MFKDLESDNAFEQQGGTAQANAPDRRRHPRLKCQLPVEIKTVGSRFPIRAETTDVSLTGCYVSMMTPLQKGCEVEFRFWVAATPISCKAVVRTSDPGVGNGIEFLSIDDLALSILGYRLQRLQEEDGRIDEPTGVIRAHR